METINSLAVDTQLVKDSQGAGREYTFNNVKDCAKALEAGYTEKLNISGGTPTTFIIWF